MKAITETAILTFISENLIEYHCTHTRLCIPIIDRIYRKMRVGIKFTEIKLDKGVICDGHHRYLASLLANYKLESIPSFRTSATEIIEWKSVAFDSQDWDTTAKINMLNQQDADYNNIPVEELLKLLK